MTEERAREIMSQVRLCQGANPDMGRKQAAQACGISAEEYSEACSYWGHRNGRKNPKNNGDAPQPEQAELPGSYTVWLVNNVTLDDWAKAHNATIKRQDTPTLNRFVIEYPKSEREVLAAKLDAARAEIRRLSKQLAAMAA